jgi:hypothetical protein
MKRDGKGQTCSAREKYEELLQYVADELRAKRPLLGPRHASKDNMKMDL